MDLASGDVIEIGPAQLTFLCGALDDDTTEV